AIAANGGQLFPVFAGRTLVAVFPISDPKVSPSELAIRSVRGYLQAVDASQVMDKRALREGFSAGLVFGPVEYGNLGATPPGRGALVGRLPQLALGLAAVAGRGDVAAAREWLDPPGWLQFEGRFALHHRDVALDGVLGDVQVSFRSTF